MSTIKLSVTIALPGSTMMTSQECDENPKENYEVNSMVLSIKTTDKKTKKTFVKRIPLEYKTRKCKEASQIINMCDEAYEYMTSISCPDWFIPQGGSMRWKRMSKIDRLECHLERVCKSVGGTSFSYIIYPD